MKLPKTATQDFYVHLAKFPRPDGNFDLWNYDLSEHDRVCLGKITLTFDIPQGVNIVEAQMACIDKQIEKANAEHYQRIGLMNQKKQELLALTHDA